MTHHTPREIAECFSGHRFEEAFPHLAEDVVWQMPGSDGLRGRDEVIAACRSTATGLEGVRVEVERFLVVDGGGSVAVDTLTRYHADDGLSVVASCDVYEFRDGAVTRITSYTVEVPQASG
ncbi:nuclear transport factor 2 family protein [Microbacterium sp. DT81.1]|uniref:nuclear transport factor 2 family protein n=1 Tax=Microbacterium sp. DT81.1 TaxID=3393413 RepID=UPI003CF02351